MPPTPESGKSVKSPRTPATKTPQSTLAAEPPVSCQFTAKDRDSNGRFVKDNRGGPGNPHARHCARMLDLFRTAITDEEMVRLYRVIYEKAANGDVSAAKLVIAYKIGKPSPCPDPDAIDRDEWDHYQHDAIEPAEMKQVLNSLPARVGNDIARTTLPLMAELQTRELAAQLQQDCPIPQEVTEETEDRTESSVASAPLANGKTTTPTTVNRASRERRKLKAAASRASRKQQVESSETPAAKPKRTTTIDQPPTMSNNGDRPTTNDAGLTQAC